MKQINAILIALFLSLTLTAQTEDYPRDTVRGKELYLYPVRQGEGLYRISKNFGVSQEDIIRYNPELQATGLRLGQVIRIPVVQRIDSSQYIIHEIQPKQTLYGISKQYGVRIARIQQLNPETAKRMYIGGKLLIAKKEELQPAAKPAPILQIPAAPQADTATLPVSAGQDTASAPISADTLHTDTPPLLLTDSAQRPIRIAYLLPFMTNAANRTPAIDRFLEFYEGALLAVNEAQDNGQHFEIYAYDTEKSEIKVEQILARPEMQHVDAIVGPAYPSQVSAVAAFTDSVHIPVLIPFSSKVEGIQHNPCLLQFNPTEEKEAQVLCDYLQAKGDSINCVLIDDHAENTPASIRFIYKEISRRRLPATHTTTREILNDSLAFALLPNAENILIFSTTRAADVLNLMPKLEAQQPAYNISLLSRYAWTEPMPIPAYYVSVFNRPQLIDLERLSYNVRHRHYFRHDLTTDNPRYDWLGYDLTAYLIKVLQTDAALPMSERIESVMHEGLQSDLHFHQLSTEGGYENALIQVLTR